MTARAASWLAPVIADPVVALNTLNLTSAAGFAVAGLTGCQVRARDGYWEATGYDRRLPRAAAFTLGCVVISRRRLPDAVWGHERSHMRQYALLGPAFWPAYLAACGWSWLRTGDWWSRNVFERRAGLRAGGYAERPVRGGRGPAAVTA